MPHGARPGHNADDVAETVLLNLLRGDLPRLGRCAAIFTGEQGALPRVKPFKCAPCASLGLGIYRNLSCAAIFSGKQGALPRVKLFKCGPRVRTCRG